MKVLRGDSIEVPHVALCLVPEILDAVELVGLVCEELEMIDADVMKFGDIKHIITAERIRIDDGIGPDFVPDDGKKRCRRDIRDDRDVNAAVSLQKPEHRNLAHGAASALAFTGSAEIALVNFDFAAEQFRCLHRQLLEDHSTQFAEKQDRRIAVYAHQSCGRMGRHTGAEILDQLN